MGRGWRSTSLPFRAKSTSFWPFILSAEYIGGTCMISPRNFSRVFSSISPVTKASCSVSTVPEISSVSVVIPSRSTVS